MPELEQKNGKAFIYAALQAFQKYKKLEHSAKY